MIYHQHLDRTCARTHTHTRVQRVIGVMAAFLCCSYYLRVSFLQKEKKALPSHKKKSSFPRKLFWKVLFFNQECATTACMKIQPFSHSNNNKIHSTVTYFSY